MSKRPPVVFDRVEWFDQAAGEYRTGTVDWVGAAQFAVEGDDGWRYMVLFNEQWKQIAHEDL